MRRSSEPFFWSLFTAGGVVVALLVPVLIVLTGFLVPAEEIGFGRLRDIFDNMLVRIVLFGLATLTFLHWANRFRHTLTDVGLSALALPISVACYAAALAGTVWAATVAFR